MGQLGACNIGFSSRAQSARARWYTATSKAALSEGSPQPVVAFEISAKENRSPRVTRGASFNPCRRTDPMAATVAKRVRSQGEWNSAAKIPTVYLTKKTDTQRHFRIGTSGEDSICRQLSPSGGKGFLSLQYIVTDKSYPLSGKDKTKAVDRFPQHQE
jgi:hypothetical protein